MNGSVFNKINDFTYGDFSIVNEKLFFKGKKIASEGKIIFSSSEEVFFLFNVEDEEVKKKFEKWLNSKFGLQNLELQYLNIEPKLFIEENVKKNIMS